MTTADPSKTTRVMTPRPSELWEIGPEANAVGIIFSGQALNDTTAHYALYTWRDNGPRELALSGKINFSDGCMYDTTSYLYADTITIDEARNWFSIPDVIDVGNDRVCKLAFDPVGYKYWRIDFTDVGVGANSADSVQAYGSFF